jgi:hypothetical protein
MLDELAFVIHAPRLSSQPRSGQKNNKAQKQQKKQKKKAAKLLLSPRGDSR